MKNAHLAAGLFVLAAILTTTASAQKAVVTSTAVVSASESIYDWCTDEVVMYSGSIELATEVWIDANNVTHLRTKMPNVNVIGVGAQSGADYIVQGGGQTFESTTTEGSRPWVSSVVSRSALIGIGPVPNEHLHTVFHLTVLADGTITAYVDEMVEKCNGK